MLILKKSKRLIIGIFICGGWFFACLALDFFLSFEGKPIQRQQHLTWSELEEFISDPSICPHIFKSKKLGQSVIETNPLIGFRIGKEWKESGFVIKDVYVLTAEEEISWAAQRGQSSNERIFVKITLVEKPLKDALTFDYMMSASEYTRIISIPASVGEEFTFNDCQKSDAEKFCYEVSGIYGRKPLMKNFRAPASEANGCGRSGGHKVVCFVPHKGGEIQSCGEIKQKQK